MDITDIKLDSGAATRGKTTTTKTGTWTPDVVGFGKGAMNAPAIKRASGGGGGGGKPAPLPPSNPNDYKWNLPPHKWSLPKPPIALDAKKGVGDMPAGYTKTPVDNKYRRGRIWWKYNDTTLSLQTQGSDKSSKLNNDDAARKYGFQFLWNPETFSTQTAVQMEATPNQNDRFLGGVGFFPATETISFNIRIDRTNDFAAANANFSRPTNITIANKSAVSSNTFISPGQITSEMVAGYKADYFLGSDQGSMKAKLADLYQRGTIADLEYLYMAINGKGPGGKKTWFNGRGIQTADIGFLMPTLLNIDIGPLSYAGYVTSLGVNHISFTRDMIPLRTDVTISLNVLATAGLTGAA